MRDMQRKSHDLRKSIYPEDVWDRLQDYWSAKYPFDTKRVLPVPVLVSDAGQQKSALLGGFPKVVVKANSPDRVASARILQAKLNRRMKKVNLPKKILELVQDTQTLGTGFMLDGFGSQYGVHNLTAYEGYDRTRYSNNSPDRIEYASYIDDDQPWSMRVHPSDITIPVGVTRMDDCYGFWHRYVRHIDDVRVDDKYIMKHRVALTPDSEWQVNEGKGRVVRKNPQHPDHVTLYDWYDFKRNRRVTYAESYPYALQDTVDEIMVRINRIPLHSLIFNSNSQYFWGTSDFEFQEPLAKEINDIRTMQTIMRHQQICKAFYDKNKVDSDEVADFNKFVSDISSDQVMSMIGIDGSPKDFIEQFTPSQVYDMIPQLQLCKEEIEQFGLGIGKLQKGIMSGGRHTAYETKVSQDYNDTALSPRRQEIISCMIEIMQNWVDLIIDFQTSAEMIPTYDATGRQVVVEFTGGDLAGDYEIDIQMESMRAQSKEDDIGQANMIMDKLMPFAQAGVVNADALVRAYMSRVSDDWDIDSLMSQQSMPMAGPVSFGQFQESFNRPGPGGPGGQMPPGGDINALMQQIMSQRMGGGGPGASQARPSGQSPQGPNGPSPAGPGGAGPQQGGIPQGGMQ